MSAQHTPECAGSGDACFCGVSQRRMNTADIYRAAQTLPLTVENLRALICAAESMALALKTSGDVTGAEAVHDACIDAFKACDDIYAIEPEELTQRERDDATDWLITRDKEEARA